MTFYPNSSGFSKNYVPNIIYMAVFILTKAPILEQSPGTIFNLPCVVTFLRKIFWAFVLAVGKSID